MSERADTSAAGSEPVRSARRRDQVLASVDDPFARRALIVAYHLRRYVAAYVVLVAAALTVWLLPSVSGSNNVATGAGAGTGGAYGSGGSGSSGGPAGPSGGSNTALPAATGASGAGSATGPAGASGGGGAAGGGGSSGAVATGSGAGSSGASGGGGSSTPTGPVGTVQVGAGTTRGGYPCKPGVKQLPYSQYSAPCIGEFAGNNGGATWNGVTASTITVAIRHTSDSTGANAAAVDAEAEAAGGVTPGVGEQYTDALVNYFNRTFELYGRHVKLVDFNGQGNGNNEDLGQDQAGACADADTAANTVHAFADLQWNGLFEYEPFAACAPRYKLLVPFGQLYYPESEFQHENPYVWSITTSCTTGGAETAEFLGKQIAPYPAQWAGSDGALSMKGTQRKFATYVPSNAGYQECATNTRTIMEKQYGVTANRFDQYNYALDISQGPSDSTKAAVQFSADHDTSVILSTDPIAPIFLTQAAQRQNYYPEWIITGVALTDQDNWAQLWDQSEVTGRLFGLSQLGSTSVALDPKGEAAIACKAAGLPLNASSALIYYELMPIFDQLQAAGPILTPANYASGTRQLPLLGGPTGADGTWYYGTGHTGIIDSREIWWNASATSNANGKTGTYEVIYGGRRFRLGQYPTGQPPFFQ